MAVSFDAPIAAGGVQPLTFSCSPPSGSSFPIGTSTVTCTVTDAAQQAATCSFTVKVQGPPRLSVTQLLAFGDSLTAGVISLAPTWLVMAETDAYPFKLRNLLTLRYTQQMITVVNDGMNGEFAFPNGRNRLPGELTRYRPEVLLLMEGTNDLLGGTTGAANALIALTAMVREARGRGVRVLLATIPPQRPGGRRDAVSKMIPGFNDSIRAIAASEGATLVDVYTPLAADLSLIGVDDLHPTPQGYNVMAQTFFDVIKANLELIQPPVSTALR